MFKAYGLYSHIRANELRSAFLLAGFVALLLALMYSFALLFEAFDAPGNASFGWIAARAFDDLKQGWPIGVAAAGCWFAIAYFFHQRMIDFATGARSVSRADSPRLYNLLENLCISRGVPIPALQVIETDALNAYASGLKEGEYKVAVTRGLLVELTDPEIEAVLAHELTHIENRDVQLMVIAAVFVGIISLVGDILVRSPRAILWSSGGRSSSSRRSSKGGGGGAIILILIAVAIFILARVLAIGLNFAMSRKREFLADAGSVELTKNPDAMISALQKVAGHSEVHAPAQVQEMFLDHPRQAGLGSLFATHPSIEARIDALVRFGGGHAPSAIEEAANVGVAPAATGTPATVPPAAAPTVPGPHDFGRRTEPPGGPWGQPRR
jgi:heat shock protein HtpX